MKFLLLLLASAPFLVPAKSTTTGSENAAIGVYSDKIVLGQTCALKGPASGLGNAMKAGLDACFTEINAKGGVDGRRVELTTLNDSYEPESCETTTKTLIEKTKAFAIIGGVGTPTAKVAMPICEERGVPYLAPFTGAELLRTPLKKWVVNLRASYFQETERLAKLLVDEQKKTKVACFYQNDAFGQAGLEGITKALERRGLTLVAQGNFERNTVAVGPALAEIAKASPDAIVMVGPYKPVAAFLKSAKQNDATKASTYCTISFVGTLDLVKDAGAAGDDTIVSQVVPLPWNEEIAIVKEYQAAMKSAGLEAEIGFTSLEGYTAGRFFCSALDKLEGEPTREAFLETIEKTGTFDIGGLKLTFGSDDHQGFDAVYLTKIQGGKVVSID
jgi:branched-chain amino acid transport system substrate-binding protein